MANGTTTETGFFALLRDITSHFGLIRNEALSFVFFLVVGVNIAAHFVPAEPSLLGTCKVIMHLFSLVPATAGTFYAMTRLPSSNQEQRFAQQLDHMLEDHERKRSAHQPASS